MKYNVSIRHTTQGVRIFRSVDGVAVEPDRIRIVFLAEGKKVQEKISNENIEDISVTPIN